MRRLETTSWRYDGHLSLAHVLAMRLVSHIVVTLAINCNIGRHRIHWWRLVKFLLRVASANAGKTYSLVRCATLQARQDVICGSNCVRHMAELLPLIHTMADEALHLFDCKLAAQLLLNDWMVHERPHLVVQLLAESV